VPVDLFRRLDLDYLYPPFLELALELAAGCRQRGAEYWAISGYRSPQEQAKIYFQGRTTPGKIVTNAKPGLSAHQYGIAVDFCLDKDLGREGLQPDFRLEAYELLAEEARKLGLESGMDWKAFREGPHVQLAIGTKGVSLVMLRGVVTKPGGTLKSAWRMLDDAGFSSGG
jgi:peptidoglycan L-alanyl-D-glutamate endopeptidase CwlK